MVRLSPSASRQVCAKRLFDDKGLLDRPVGFSPLQPRIIEFFDELGGEPERGQFPLLRSPILPLLWYRSLRFFRLGKEDIGAQAFDGGPLFHRRATAAATCR